MQDVGFGAISDGGKCQMLMVQSSPMRSRLGAKHAASRVKIEIGWEHL